jgi:NAD(P)H dehydrogenase (quinone)
MVKVLVLYYSRSGNTAKMAEYVAEGARKTGADVVVKSIAETKPEELVSFDGIIIGSPTYYGTMAGEIKMFIDETVRFHGQLVGKAGGAFASSGGLAGGNETTCLDIVKALLIHGMVIPGNIDADHYGAVSVGSPDKRSIEQCRILGKLVASLAKRLTNS